MESNIIKSRLMAIGKSQDYLSRIFRRSKSQISQAISSDRFPTLKEKIINHIKLLEDKK
jgi:hypothetical protein